MAVGDKPGCVAAKWRAAIKLAEQANQLFGATQPDVLDTLAASFAEAGQFADALATAQEALNMATQQNKLDLVDGLRTRIALYKAGKPFRQRDGKRDRSDIDKIGK